MRITRRTASLLVLLALGACHRQSAPTASQALSITLLTADGTAPQQAAVTIRDEFHREVFRTTTPSPNRFVATLPPGRSRISLDVAIPEHLPLRISLWLPPSGPAEFTIRLRAATRGKTASSALVRGDFNRFSSYGFIQMKPDERGVLRAAIPFHGDSARFEIGGFGHMAAWMPVTSYALVPREVGPPAFSGVLKPLRDTLFFAVDPSTARTASPPASVTTRTRDESLALANRLIVRRADAQTASGVDQSWRPPGSSTLRDDAAAEADSILRTAADSRVRSEALVTVLRMRRLTLPQIREYGTRLLRECAPGCVVVQDTMGFGALRTILLAQLYDTTLTSLQRVEDRHLRVQRVREYVLPIARTTGDSTLQVEAWSTAMTALSDSMESQAFEALRDSAIAELPNGQAKYFFSQQRDTRRLRTGELFPPFRALSDAGNVDVSNDVFRRAPFTIVHAWFTLCCMPTDDITALQQIRRQYDPRRLGIVSLAFMDSVGASRQYRQHVPMPWTHGWLEPYRNNETPGLHALHMWVRQAVLVDSTGRVVVPNLQLRPADWERELARVVR